MSAILKIAAAALAATVTLTGASSGWSRFYWSDEQLHACEESTDDLTAADRDYLTANNIKTPPDDLSLQERRGVHAVLHDPKFQSDPSLLQYAVRTFISSVLLQNLSCELNTPKPPGERCDLTPNP
jgi:hypothetical protein